MKAHIGDVLVTPADCTNPYTYHGPLSHQHPASAGELVGQRVEALRAFYRGSNTKGMALWHAPANGGARRITRDDVAWESSGLAEHQRVHAVVEVAIEFNTFLMVSDASLKERIANDLRADGYVVNDISVLRYLVESPSTATLKET